MCAIAGLWLTRPLPAEELTARALAMADRMARRGPDGRGVWIDASRGLALAHRRLAIADLSPAGAQPRVRSNPTQALVYNGEIYDHLQWRYELGLSPQAPGGDTATLAAGLSRWGVDASCRRARGMFALAWWDGEAERLTLARDRAGEKPLLLARGDWGLAFASDLAPLMQLPWIRPSVDPTVLREVLQWGHASGRGTLVAGIERVLPGEVQVYERACLHSRRRWWSLAPLVAQAATDAPRITDPQSAVRSVLQTLHDSVRERMVAAVPVGVFLSGGIDSALVAATMAAVAREEGRGPVHSHSLGFDDPQLDESQAARSIAQALGTEHHAWHMSGAHARDLMPLLPQITGEPLADASQLPTTLLALRASSNLRVVLTGDGGDELFGGYVRYRQALGIMGLLGSLPQGLRGRMADGLQSLGPSPWNALARAIPARWRPSLPASKVDKLTRWLQLSDANARARAWMQLWDPDGLMPQTHRAQAKPASAAADWLQDGQAEGPTPWPSKLPASERMQALEWSSVLPGDLLAKMDRATMWASVEARSPLLDPRMIELAWRLDPSLKAEGRRTKEVLRLSLATQLEPALFDRPKRGFSAPLARWLSNELREPAADLLDSLMGHTRGRWNTAAIAQAWHGQLEGRRHETDRLWCLIVLEQWRRHWKLEWPSP